jgi:uncharacterized phage protein (TIGR01671 family)
MNKEFRAWDKRGERMLQVVEPQEQGKREYYPFEVQIGFSSWDKEDIVLLQYTGLKDCNGKKIYEGDIIRHNIKGFKLFVVQDIRLDVHTLAIMIKERYDNPELKYQPVEVIGNIYENPELLEEKNGKN